MVAAWGRCGTTNSGPTIAARWRWRLRLPIALSAGAQAAEKQPASDLGAGDLDRRLGRRPHRAQGQGHRRHAQLYRRDARRCCRAASIGAPATRAGWNFPSTPICDKLIGWKGATTHFTIYQIHNSGHTAADNVGSIADPSNIDALATTRLFTAWFEQSFDERVFAAHRPARGRRRIHHQPDRRRPDQRHVRLGRHPGRQYDAAAGRPIRWRRRARG